MPLPLKRISLKLLLVEPLTPPLQRLLGALTKQDTVSLVGFGTFSVKHRAAREGRNPRSGEDHSNRSFNRSWF